MTQALRVPEGMDIARPSQARIYDYLLRGSHYLSADARAAERIFAIDPREPTGLLMTGVMMFAADASDPWDLVLTHTGMRGAEDAELADSDGPRWLYCGVARLS